MKKLIYLTLLLLVPLAGAQEKVVNSYGTVPQVGFGSVASNALYFANDHLLWTNNIGDSKFEVHNASDHVTSVGANDSYGSIQTDLSSFVLGFGAKSVTLNAASSGTMLPNSPGVIAIGAPSNPFLSLAVTNTVYMGTNQLTYTGTDLYWNGVKINP